MLPQSGGIAAPKALGGSLSPAALVAIRLPCRGLAIFIVPQLRRSGRRGHCSRLVLRVRTVQRVDSNHRPGVLGPMLCQLSYVTTVSRFPVSPAGWCTTAAVPTDGSSQLLPGTVRHVVKEATRLPGESQPTDHGGTWRKPPSSAPAPHDAGLSCRGSPKIRTWALPANTGRSTAELGTATGGPCATPLSRGPPEYSTSRARRRPSLPGWPNKENTNRPCLACQLRTGRGPDSCGQQCETMHICPGGCHVPPLSPKIVRE